MKTAVARPISCVSRADRDFVVIPASAMLKKHWKGTAWVAITVAVWAIVVGNYLGGALLGAVGLLLFTLLAGEPIPPPGKLFAAIGTRDVDTAHFLLDAKADPNARVAKGPSPLEDAVRRRLTAIVDLLLEHGARPDVTADGQDSALAIAAYRNQRTSAMLLVTAGADPMAANPGRLGGTPLSLAVGGSYTNYVERNWLVLIEAVTSHGPINVLRHNQLKNIFAGSTAGLVFVTTFLARATMRKYLPEIAWETEVWVADAPDHLIHFNGERFLGPYETNE